MKKPAGRPALAASAAALATLIPMARLHPGVRKWAESRPIAERWHVALSGGADSVALLLLLWAHWPERRGRLRALHFDHRLRGRASRGDAIFCRRLCGSLEIALAEGRWAAAKRGASEADARAVRLAFFARRSQVLWLGHQQDDVAESLLMRLARGSGSRGLAAPRPVQPMPKGRVHLRPLLNVKKAEIVAALRSAGIAWREDATNAETDFFRNRIRRDVVPAWQDAARRDAIAGAAQAREYLEEDDDALESWLDELAPLENGTLNLSILADKPRALLRRALHRWLLAQPKAGELSRPAVEALLTAAARGQPTRQSLGRKGFAVIRGGRLHFELAGKRRGKFHGRAN